MFEELGAQQKHDETGQPTSTSVDFKVFFPGLGRGAYQYLWGGPTGIKSLGVVGSFQNWDCTHPKLMNPTPSEDGELYAATVDDLPPLFHEYKYLVTFTDGTQRLVADPCAHYTAGGYEENCGFVVDDPGTYRVPAVKTLSQRLPARDLVIYELMIDDYTAAFRGSQAPVAAISDAHLQRIKGLGFNAIEFMPWTAWPGGKFNWGYEPYLFFAPEHRYVNDPTAPTVKLDALKDLISRCHAQDLHVIMDGVFNHASASRKGLGFPYYWMYRRPEDCPFVGSFEGGGYFQDLDYENPCCQAFIADACKYWIQEFKVDGLRLDYTLGFYDPERSDVGLTKLIKDVRAFEPDPNFYIAIEHLTDNRYEAIDVCNKVGATSNWFDSSFFACRDGLLNKRSEERRNCPVDKELMRIVNSSMDYDEQRCPTIYLSNHDHSAPGSFAEGQAHWWRLQPWLILLYTLPGAVLLYNGQEFADDVYVPESGSDRVSPRPLRWDEKLDMSVAGQTVQRLCSGLARIRAKHPALRSRNVYPGIGEDYDTAGSDWLERLNTEGYGLEVASGTLIFHRWSETPGDRRFIIVLNFSDIDRTNVEVHFSSDGAWTKLRLFDGDGTGGDTIQVSDGKALIDLGSNFGHVFMSS